MHVSRVETRIGDLALVEKRLHTRGAAAKASSVTERSRRFAELTKRLSLSLGGLNQGAGHMSTSGQDILREGWIIHGPS